LMTPDNVYLNGSGRKCKTCARANQMERYAQDPEFRAKKSADGRARYLARKVAA
jgi:hypothetical protein